MARQVRSACEPARTGSFRFSMRVLSCLPVGKTRAMMDSDVWGNYWKQSIIGRVQAAGDIKKTKGWQRDVP
ncbi:hypothetical protein WUBG_07428 [Wuchereria bancrofti]|uniref:Uncharacterized protein n=1 Tax=Wuchereria bancrofti TaxID=6293 RepID=J9EWV9_WUCBA|nr:hypothetical protein WUBG_07428 [Wuchereria bancrofti]